MNCLVSIIIPCYNGSSFILQTIQSVFNQTYQNIEIIFVNDGSTDSSLELVQQLNDNKIIIINKENSGVSDSRNIGFSKSKGKYILFLDADDLLSENFIENGVSAIEQNKVDFCTVYIQKIGIDGSKISTIDTHGAYNKVQKSIATFNSLISTCPSAYLLKKEFLLKNKIGFNPKLSSPADKHFLLQVGKYGDACLLKHEDALMYYRINPNSMSNKSSKKLLLEQELFYNITIQDNLLEGKIKRIFTHKMAYQLLSTFIKMKDFKKAFKYFILYLKSF